MARQMSKSEFKTYIYRLRRRKIKTAQELFEALKQLETDGFVFRYYSDPVGLLRATEDAERRVRQTMHLNAEHIKTIFGIDVANFLGEGDQTPS